jgi:hypothetical protein
MNVRQTTLACHFPKTHLQNTASYNLMLDLAESSDQDRFES